MKYTYLERKGYTTEYDAIQKWEVTSCLKVALQLADNYNADKMKLEHDGLVWEWDRYAEPV